MMATTHILTGAAVAKVLRRPQWAWPGAFLSYFLLDALPHVNLEQYYHYPAKGFVALIDACVGVALATWLLRGQPHRRVMVGGVVVVLVVGIVTNVSNLMLWFSALVSHPLLPRTNQIVGMAMQLAVFLAAVCVLRHEGNRGEVREEP